MDPNLVGSARFQAELNEAKSFTADKRFKVGDGRLAVGMDCLFDPIVWMAA